MSNFEIDKYIKIPNCLSIEDCNVLTAELKKLVAQGQTREDDQCPFSHVIHGHPIFDGLLLDLLPYIEKASGKKLYPTYSYARLYGSGAELTIHTDRPACEISVTLTLGWSGKQWPIYMADLANENEAEPYNSQGSGIFKDIKVKNISAIWMDVGDAVLYRGIDKLHWREKFEGDWQAQVFLHYVDVDGPHADEKYDGRDKLSIKLKSDEIQSITDCAVFKNHLSNDFCDNLIKRYSQEDIEKEPPFIGNGTNNIDKSIRDVERVLLPQNVGIGATLIATGLNANKYWWKYNITHGNQTELLIYKPEGHYNAHVDTFHNHSDETRKLTVLAFLNDDFEGGKFFIQTSENRFYPPQEKGTIIVFPSFVLHGVEPVIKGVRYSCVSWMAGPYFK